MIANSKRFTRTIEDFVCEHCGAKAVGDGYTNHCPKCLWSKHVDKNPGDRLESCGGMMKPFRGEREGKGYKIQHVCTRCGFMRWNRLDQNDDFNAFLELFDLGPDKKN